MTKKDNFKVDFIGIGAERSGTTWLAACLAEHPEICFSSQKEIYFFNDLDRHFLKLANLRYRRGISWYKKFFAHCKPGRIKGEFTPTYLFCPTAAVRIKKHFPNVKLVVVLRDPTKRAFSQYLNNLRVGVIPNITFEKALKRLGSYIKKGYYYKHLKVYFSLFPKQNIKVVLMDDINKNSSRVVKDLYKFLGVADINFRPGSLNRNVNGSQKAKWRFLNYLMVQTELFLRRHRFDSLLRFLEDVGIRKFAYDFDHFVNVDGYFRKPKMNKKTKAVLREIFRHDIIKLEKLIGRNLDAWK